MSTVLEYDPIGTEKWLVVMASIVTLIILFLVYVVILAEICFLSNWMQRFPSSTDSGDQSNPMQGFTYTEFGNQSSAAGNNA